MLLAWKTELSRFAGGLLPSEIRSAVLLGLIGFVIYPVLPNRYVDPWQLFNPRDAWVSVIAIAGIGFVNYVFLRVYSTRGLYLGALFGGLVNSSATVAELGARLREAGMVNRTSTLVLLTTIAMFARNLILATIFSPRSLSATLVPLLAMTLVAIFWVWRDRGIEQKVPGTLTLTSPVSISKVLWFGMLFISIQIVGTLLTKYFGNYGMLATGVFGGLVSSASTTAAAATFIAGRHGRKPPGRHGIGRRRGKITARTRAVETVAAGKRAQHLASARVGIEPFDAPVRRHPFEMIMRRAIGSRHRAVRVIKLTGHRAAHFGQKTVQRLHAGSARNLRQSRG